jgi:transcriptional regulator of aromatic amino acid metabolism
MPEYFSTLCKDRIEVRRGILDILVLHSLDLKNKMRFICFNYVFFSSYRSEIESCNLDR